MREPRERNGGIVRILRWAAVPLVAAAMVAPSAPRIQAAAHTAEVAITANKSASGGLAFNGYPRGGMTITVPVGWQVVVHFENADTTPHSLAVLPSGAHAQMAPPSTPAFAGASTPNFANGTAKGQPVTLTFEASKPGTYEFLCGVPGHAITGQWAGLVVSATADAPSVTPPAAATITVK